MEDSVTDSESLVPSLNLSSKGRAEDQDQEQEQAKEKRDEGQEEKSVGFINHLISNLVSPLSPRPREVDEGKVEANELKRKREENGPMANPELSGGGGGGGGGLINNLISNFFHQSEGDGEEKEKKNEEEKVEVVEGHEQAKTKEEKGGGGIINNLVSHLPISLPDNAVPATDEASILIHSIIHD